MTAPRESTHESGGEALARAFGLALVVLLVLHVLETSSAIFGREAFLSRSAALLPPWARAVLVAPLLWHGRMIFRADASSAGRYPDAGVRKLQRLAGIVLLVFLVIHLGHALVPALSLPAAAAYERLRHDLAKPGYVGIYVVGITAACLHIGQGIEAVSTDVGSRFGERHARVARTLGFATAVALFAVAMNTLSHFAAGRALVVPDAPR